MKVYELEFTEEGSTADEVLNEIARRAGYNSARHMLYSIAKWTWDVDALKVRLLRENPVEVI